MLKIASGSQNIAQFRADRLIPNAELMIRFAKEIVAINLSALIAMLKLLAALLICKGECPEVYSQWSLKILTTVMTSRFVAKSLNSSLCTVDV